MTNIYAYCLFGQNEMFCGVYSSLRAAHRDALKLCNKGSSEVFLKSDEEYLKPSLKTIKKMFKGEFDTKVQYISSSTSAIIIKTRLKE